jgi:hypothetical protein
MDQYIQLQQKIIYYRSELSNYENKLKKLQNELQKEKMRSEYLQERLHLAQTANIEEYEKKIALLENKLLSYEVALEEEKKQINMLKKSMYLEEYEKKIAMLENKLLSYEAALEEEKKQTNILKNQIKTLTSTPPKIIKLQAFFNYSLIIPNQDEEEDLLVIGNFTVENIGTEPLQNIIICVRITPKQSGRLSGKIATSPVDIQDSSSVHEQLATEWTFVHNNWREKIKNEGEYWLKPVHHSVLEPNKVLQFSNFEIRFKKGKVQNATVVEGFAYCKEIPKGVTSLNNIIINY